MSSLPNGKDRRKGTMPVYRLGIAPHTGDVSPYAATCRHEVIETSWDLDALLRHLVALTRSADPSDFAVWEDERLVAAVFGNGQVVIFRHLSVTLAADPTRDTTRPEGL